MNKTKVLVFTQKGKWNNIDDKILNRVTLADWDEKYPNEDNPIVKCGFSGAAFLIPVALDKFSDEEGVFLVYDSINSQDFHTLEQQCSGDMVYVLTHSTGTCQQSKFINWQPKPFVLSGKHTNSDKDYYYPLFDILTDNADNKPNRIIDTIFKPHDVLENVLQFLHGCLVPNNSDDSFKSSYNKLLANNDMQEIVKDFFVNTYSQPRIDESAYQEKLSQLRDTLLKYALN